MADDIYERAAEAPDAVLRYAPHDDGLVDVYLPARPLDRSLDPARPLLVFVHGGFWRQAFDRRHARPLASALALLGWVVALPEYRRVGGAGGWPATGEDVDRAVRTLPGLLRGIGVETSSTTLVGHSAGGHLVLWLAGQDHPLRRVVALAPVGDLREAAARGTGGGAVVDLLGGTPEQVPEAYDAADPGSRLHDRPGADVVVVHGDHDSDVPVENSRGLAARFGWLDLRELAGVEHGDLVDPRSQAWPAVLDAIGPPGE